MGVRLIFKQLGRVNASLYIASRALDRVTGSRLRIVKYQLVAQPIGGDGQRPLRPDPATTIVSVAGGDALVRSFPRPPQVIERRYRDGARCSAALVRGEFAGFIWLQTGRYEEDELRCSYVLESPELSVWDYDVYVTPAFRLGRTMARLWGQVDADLAARGVRWSFSRISAFNPASLSSHARLGTVDCGSLLFLMAGPLQLSILPRWPFLHLSASDRQAPVVRLRLPG